MESLVESTTHNQGYEAVLQQYMNSNVFMGCECTPWGFLEYEAKDKYWKFYPNLYPLPEQPAVILSKHHWIEVPNLM